MPNQTGPRTPEGKARSSINAIKHGFSSEHLLVPESQREEFNQLRADLLDEISPIGALQRIAFNRLVHAAWNLHRLMLTENEIFASHDDPLANETAARQLDRLARYQARHERAYQRALKELQQLQTNHTIRATLPDELEDAVPTLADVQQIHSAKRNQRTCWPTFLEQEMDAMDRDLKDMRRREKHYEDRKREAA